VSDVWLARLKLYIPPPARPNLGPGTWEEAFAALGTRLPEQYVDLMSLYGGGLWGNWLECYQPLGSHRFRGLVPFWKSLIDGHHMTKETFPDHVPPLMWPDPGGLLPFGSSADGDKIGWVCHGDPETWKVVLVPRHERSSGVVYESIAEVLFRWLRDELEEPGLAGLSDEADAKDFATFEPFPSDEPDGPAS
jgi:hypothetical protein